MNIFLSDHIAKLGNPYLMEEKGNACREIHELCGYNAADRIINSTLFSGLEASSERDVASTSFSIICFCEGSIC